MKLAKRHGFDSNFKDSLNLSNQDEMDLKVANLKAKLARRNNSMKSQTVLEQASDNRDLSPSTQKYQSGKILAITNGESSLTSKKTSKREGLLRLVNSIGENIHEQKEAEERKELILQKNMLREYSRTGNMTTLMNRKDSRNDSLNSRGTLESPEKVTVSSI